MIRRRQAGFTLTEILVVISIIGILVSLLLPAIQNSREVARRSMCANHLLQLIIAVQNYEDALQVYPPGTIDAQGPIANLPQGYHHNWIEQILPYLELQNTYRHIDRSVPVYHRNNDPVRDAAPSNLFRCPSSVVPDSGFSGYAAVHHDVESPIDVDNNGVFFLNSHVRRIDVTDGHSSTLFLGEKIALAGDMGWQSGTRATLRNTGTRPNAVQKWVGTGFASNAVTSQGFRPLGVARFKLLSEEDRAVADKEVASGVPIVSGLPTTPTAVGGFESFHLGGVNFVFGDGSIRFIKDTINMQVYQRLGHRADGQLLSEDF